ncbi:hypothetical protein EMCG_09752 [[Emmonsia] crescens]|uniref:BZIP domain-containing protein n=1 Tax=[Emmonsia] crescens TaxID=73230 RepID=A0A0G2J2N8_9EURO|nr:hypothetical protein EMCG_09752 [Emmonsia crescens UAMH 3008]
MSGYNGRRAPNFSQYLNDLNTIPSPYDQAQQEQEQQDLFDVDAELALFTNAEFLDFDAVGDLPVDMPVKFETGKGADLQNKDTSTTALGDGNSVKYIDMLNDFNLPSYPPGYSSPILPIQAPIYPLPQPQGPNHNGTPLAAGDLITPPPISAMSPSNPSPSSSTTTSMIQGTKRRQDSMTPGSQSIDEAARLAQEEDKRRRNTAASARFRIKKKEREKNMERTVKDVTAKNATLEARVNQLEMENRWLKNLITEKNGGAIADGDIAGMFDKYRASTEASQQRKPPSSGVETSAA